MQRSFLIYPVLIFFLGGLAYVNSLGNGFTFDDGAIVLNNPVIRVWNLGAIFSEPWWPGRADIGLYRPLTTLTFALNYQAHDVGPYGYHLVNVLLHLLNGALVFWIAFRVLGHAAAAGVTALVFVLHPIQTEAVNGLVGRAELLSAFWVLFAWLMYLVASYETGRLQRVLYNGALVAGFVGCFAKEHAAVLVGFLAVYDFVLVLRRGEASPFRYFLRNDVKRYVPFVLIVGVFLAIRHLVVGAILLPSQPLLVDNSLAYLPGWQRALTAIAILGKYVGLLVAPVTLSADYSFNQIPAVASVFDFRFLAGLGVVAATVFVIVQGVRGRLDPVWGFGPALILLALLPVSNLLFPIGTILGERLLYLPSIGFCFLLGVGYRRLTRTVMPVWIPVTIAGLLLGVYSVRTHLRNLDWRNDFTLFSATVRSAPNSAKAHFNLGSAFREQGELKKALDAYWAALEIYPEYAEVHYNIGVTYQDFGQEEKAEGAYRQALEVDPAHVSSWVNLGSMLGRKGRNQEALDAFGRARDLVPNRADVVYNYGLACQQLGRVEEATQAYQRVLKLVPGFVDAAINLGDMYARTGRMDETVRVYERLLQAKPEAYQVAFNLAVLKERSNQPGEAASLFLQASSEPGERGALGLYRAGMLYKKLGETEAARHALAGFIARWPGDPTFTIAARRHLAELE